MKNFSFIRAVSFKKIISSVLLFTLIVSQTIRVDFFPSTNARVDDYRDIVSIIVDEKTYNKLKSEITRYSEDITKYLGHTQVVVNITNSSTTPAEIAANNEKLYYEGLEGVDSRLVGTILIGDIPVAMVSQDGKYFPSLFPYVDFDNKAFVYNEKSEKFLASDTNSGVRAVEIWHWVINPRLGVKYDISDEDYYTFLKNFFEKTKVFYDQNHPNHDLVFPSDKAPRVFYFDWFNEWKSLDARSVYQYDLSIQNSENYVYGKMTKEVLRDVNNAIKNFDQKNNKEYNSLLSSVSSDLNFSEWSITEEQINDISDVYAPKILSEILNDYNDVFNKKILGEELAAVHNAGRYNQNWNVNADLIQTKISIIDEEAKQAIKRFNDVIEASLNHYITEKNFARRIPIGDTTTVKYWTGRSYSYDNYFFWENSKNIKNANQCTIARWYSGTNSEFGRSILTEANVEFDVQSTQNHIDMLKNDRTHWVYCLEPMSLEVFWWWNSILKNAKNQSNKHPLKISGDAKFKWFVKPIFSIGWMTESDRIQNPSITQCMDDTYQYSIMNPYIHVYYDTITRWDNDYTIPRYEYYPNDTRWTYFSCKSELKTANKNSSFGDYKILINSDIFEEYKNYKDWKCLVGSMKIDWQNAMVNRNSCIEEITTSDWDGGTEVTRIDRTHYRDIVYHTIDPLFLHTSPTIEEIELSAQNGATQSLAVDENRFVEFLTQKWQVAKLYYPNAFDYYFGNLQYTEFGELSIRNLDFTQYIGAVIYLQWKYFLENEDKLNQDDWFSEFLEKFLKVKKLDKIVNEESYGSLPEVYSATFEKILENVKVDSHFISAAEFGWKWLSKNFEEKHKIVVASLLSDNAREIFNQPLYGDLHAGNIITSDFYEIAYLGLEDIKKPKISDDDNLQDFSKILEENANSRAQIQALNIVNLSENFSNSNNWKNWNNWKNNLDAECGSPEGVELSKWPSAIQCWMKKNSIPRITAWYCADKTIWYSDSDHKLTNDISSKEVDEQKNELAKSIVTTNFSRTSLSYNQTMTIKPSLQNDIEKFIPPFGTKSRLIIESVVSNGQLIKPEDYSKYFSLDNLENKFNGFESSFLLKTNNQNAIITLYSIVTVPYVDWTVWEFRWTSQKIIISDSYLEADIVGSDDISTPVIYADSDVNNYIKVNRKNSKNESFSEQNFSIKIFDDIRNTLVLDNQIEKNGKFLIPNIIAQNPGSYRAVLVNDDGISGEISFSVRSGKLKNLSISSTSSAIIKDSTTIATLSLLDSKNNPVPLDLYNVSIKIENGYIIDVDGNSRDSINLDIFDSSVNFSIKSSNSNDIKIIAKVDNFSTEKIIKVYDSANIKVQMEWTPKTGWDSVLMRIIVTDSNGNKIKNFSSVLNVSIPEIAGYFSKDLINVLDGQSEVFEYIPGRVSGTYNLTLAIPGVGVSDQTPLLLLPGDWVYIDHSVYDDKIFIYIRDRFGNVSNFSGQWFIENDSSARLLDIDFANWIAEITRSKILSWKLIVNVPALENSKINYSDATWTHSIDIISKYWFEIIDDNNDFGLSNNHNALYTVLAWGSFLNVANNILYWNRIDDWRKSLWKNNEAKELWRALSASTLLASPYSDDNLFLIFPNGGYSAGFSNDSIIEAKLNIERWYPVLNILDSVRSLNIAKVLYKTNNAQFQICDYDNVCKNNSNQTLISWKILQNNSNFSFTNQNNSLFLTYNNRALLSIKNDGSIQKDSSISISTKEYDTTDSFVMEINYNWNVIAEVSYSYSGKNSVILSNNIFEENNANSPILYHASEQLEKISDKIFNWNIYWFRIFKTLPYKIFDDTKTSPNNIDDIGTLPENLGVGWMGDNRMLLSFAGGDTVGEATKWFHTYMFVNLGDPVAHIKHNWWESIIDWLDRTIWTHLADSRRSYIQDFFQKDMNNDGLTDIVIQYVDGYIELLLNLGWKFRSIWNIAYIPNLTNSKILIADFTGDKYSDIAILNSDWEIVILSNNDRKFTTEKIFIENNEKSPIRIQQFKSYDMDADNKDDIVYLTSAWELGILYWTEKSANFTKKILDSTLGITLMDSSDNYGWAIFADNLDDFSTKINNSMVSNEVYYKHQDISSKNISSQIVNSDINLNEYLQNDSNSNVKIQNFVKSQYSSIAWLEISKKYNSTNNVLYPDDIIRTEIIIKNNSSKNLKNISYLDSIANIFARDDSITYDIEIDGQKVQKNLKELNFGDYNLLFELDELQAWKTAKIIYTLKVLPASYGEMQVWDFEKWLVWADNYGDVIFKTSITCWAEMMSWLSSGARDYISSKTAPSFAGIPYPDSIASEIADSNGNNIPDHIDNFHNSPEKQKQSYNEIVSSNSKDIVTINHKKEWWILDIDLNLNEEFYNKTSKKAQEIADWLSCGFGGGSCMSFPLNWAPLAPGSDPIIFGNPVGDGLKPEEGLPIFSALTTLPTPYGPMPFIWPPSPIGAGWYFGDKAPYHSFIRIFVTPTLTMGMGTAVCLGQNPSAIGMIPPPALSPLIPGGNCIVSVKPMPVCKWDGSKEDGDVSAISGLVAVGWKNSSWNSIGPVNSVWNWESCNLRVSATKELKQSQKELEKEIISYIQQPTEDKIKKISQKFSNSSGINSLNSGPLLTIGNSSADASEIFIDSNTSISDFGKIINPKNIRVSAFPDFVMEWLTRQTDNIVNSLLTPPNLTIIPPTDFGQNAQIDSSYSEFFENSAKIFSQQSLSEFTTQVGDSYKNTNIADNVIKNATSWWNSSAWGYYDQFLNNYISNDSTKSAINSVGWWLNAIKTAYTFLGKMPFLNISTKNININVPWILPRELDQYERKLKEYQTTITETLNEWCVNDNSAECIQSKWNLQNSGLMASIMANLRRIEEYRNFPDKLQKYVNWKEELMYQILCNIEIIEKMTFGWVRDNWVRFERWAELYVLIKAIAESWQPVLDIFANMNASCWVCRNERYNSQYWKFKLISMIIPDIPIINFPTWPDFVLDLSDIRLWINVTVPEFNFKLSPIRLPNLPDFSLPNSPNASLKLPTIPELPPLPDLPDLPTLPSLPQIKLPDLPPPPKLPKIAAQINSALNILKLIAKMYCFYQKTFLIPEWQVGDVIAQRTERQWTLPFDFLDLQFPQFSLPSLKEIRVSSHVNYEIESDFISEYAKNAVKPINEFSTDLSKWIPSQIGNNLNISSPVNNVHIDASSSEKLDKSLDKTQKDIQNSSNNFLNSIEATINKDLQSYNNYDFGKIKNILSPIIQQYEADKNIFLTNEEFYSYFRQNLIDAELYSIAHSLDSQIASARLEAQKTTQDIKNHITQRSNLLKNFVNEQNQNIAEMQNFVDLLRDEDNLLANVDFAGKFVSLQKNNQNSLALSQLETLESRALDQISAIKNSYDRTSTLWLTNQLNTRVKRIVQATATEIKNPKDYISNISNQFADFNSDNWWYLPKFKWMYVLTEKSNTQTKLFDYTELVNPKDRVDVIDIDNDGDRDYIFVLGGVLYIKNTHLNSPQKIIDTKITVKNIPSEIPEVANNFVEIVSTPSEINASFKNTVSQEKEWRLEFFDKYLEWNKASVSNNFSTPKITVDLFLKSDFIDSNNSLYKTTPIARTLIGWYNSSEFVLEWPKITKIEVWQYISISPGRTIYTTNRHTDIKYKKSSWEEFALRLEPNTAYQFSETLEMYIANSPIYIIGWAGSHKYTSADNLEWLPIIAGMKLISSDSSLVIRDNTHSSNLIIDKNSLYIAKNINSISGKISFSLSYPNGYYYARLHHLSNLKNDRAWVILLSPQLSSDSSAPIVSIDSVVRVPVYAETRYNFSDIITELSSYTVTVDEDISQDEDNNSIFDDDFVSKWKNISINNSEIIFWKYDSPGNKNIILKVRDENWNTTLVPIVVEVFTPIANLENATISGSLDWKLDTIVEWEPIDFFRVRNSELPIRISENPVISLSGGLFSSWIALNDEKIIASSSTSSWNISPNWIIENLPNWFDIRVNSASAFNPMSIEIFDNQNISVYKQFISLPANSRIVNSDSDLSNNVIISTYNGYNSILSSVSDPSLSGWAYITDKDQNPIALISRDWNIYLLNSDLSLRYSPKNNYLNFSIIKDNQVIADFTYKINFFFTKK